MRFAFILSSVNKIFRHDFEATKLATFLVNEYLLVQVSAVYTQVSKKCTKTEKLKLEFIVNK